MKKTAYVLLSFVLAIIFLTFANALWGSPIPISPCGNSLESGVLVDPHQQNGFVSCYTQPTAYPDAVYAAVGGIGTVVYLYNRSSSKRTKNSVSDVGGGYTGSDGSITINDNFPIDGPHVTGGIKTEGPLEDTVKVNSLSDIPVTAE